MDKVPEKLTEDQIKEIKQMATKIFCDTGADVFCNVLKLIARYEYFESEEKDD